LSTVQTLAHKLRTATLVTLAILLAVLFAWRASDSLSIGDGVLLGVLTLPAWCALPGLWQGRRRTYGWMSMAITPYLILGITEAVANPAQRLWAGACLLISLVLFALLVGYLRVSAPAPSPPSPAE
jgi:uncharacterized membrane protein